jgi:hypothetical protein
VVGAISRMIGFPAVHGHSRCRLFINQSFFEQSPDGADRKDVVVLMKGTSRALNASRK